LLLLAAIFFAATTTPAWSQNLSQRITDRGIELPMKWGLGLSLYNQTQPYDIIELEVPLAGLDIGAAEDLEIRNSTDSYHLKLDYWLVPFFNVYLLGGYIDGTTNVKLSNVDLGLPILLNDLKVEYSGFMYGAGATLAVGGKKWFSSLVYHRTWTDLDVSTSTVDAWLVSPNVGLVFPGASIWVGATYQQAQETHEGVWEMPFLGEVPYYAKLEQEVPWNYHVGLRGKLSEHWNLVFRGGFGERKSALAHLEYRFGKR
jgi:hypothetical protein